MQLWDIEQTEGVLVKGRFQRDENGHEVWVLTAKRQWNFVDNQWLEVEAEEIYDDPVQLAEPNSSVMKIDHEFAVTKQNTDVLVYGKARSYAKRPVPYHECRVLIDGHIDKTISVHGERQWIRHGGAITVSNPQPFIEADIHYGQALGGDERNRVGCGIASSTEQLLEKPVPSVFFPRENWAPNSKSVRVAGFGPIAPFFSERTQYAGTFDEHWLEHRRPLLPEDFDQKFYQSAPSDQQCCGFLEGSERLMMSGFNHDDVITFRLPTEKYVAQVLIEEDNLMAPMHIYTLFVDTEQMTLTVSYGASFPCQGKEHLLVSAKVSQSKEKA